MTTKRLPYWSVQPLFIFLLPVFFVLHGFTGNYGFVPVKDALLLTGIYLISSVVLLLLFRLLYKNRVKAALTSFVLMAFHFFFGAIHDALRSIFPGSFISKYIFILPASFFLLALIIFLLKRTKRPLRKLTCYLNILLLLVILIDVAGLINKTIINGKDASNTLSREWVPCDSCRKPDVYVIIFDEYAGNNELKDVFHFDNIPFIQQLSGLGFHTIPRSSSNYNYTPYSIASTLNMDYLNLQRSGKLPLLTYSYETVRDNHLLKFLQYHNYRFYNYSLFDFKGQPANTIETFLPAKTKLITSQTFLSRLDKEISYHLITTLKWKRKIRKSVYFNKKNNESLYQLTLNTAVKKTNHPKFVLTHLMMPHYPYYFDKNGNEFPFEQLTEGNQNNYHNYIEYLQYCNKKILELAKHILSKSTSPPVIILLSDHGFRHFKQPEDEKYYFSNLISVHLPGLNYSAFPDSLTNVNLFRTVLNVSFHQQLPYLKDTAIILDNP